MGVLHMGMDDLTQLHVPQICQHCARARFSYVLHRADSPRGSSSVNNVLTTKELLVLRHVWDVKPVSEVHHTCHRLSERWNMHCARQWALLGLQIGPNREIEPAPPDPPLSNSRLVLAYLWNVEVGQILHTHM